MIEGSNLSVADRTVVLLGELSIECQSMTNSRQSATDLIAEPLVRSLAVRWPSGHQTGLHAHDWGQVVFAVTGALAVDATRQRWIVPAHRCLWVPPELQHDLLTIGETRLRTIYLCPALAASMSNAVQVLDVSPLLRELLVEITKRGMLFEANELDRCFATMVIAQIADAPQLSLGLPLPHDPRARLVADRVYRAPDTNAPLAELAIGVGASERTIERLFTKETGLSFGRWRQQARLQHAMRVLSDGRSVTQAAMDCGYGSVSAFITAFRGTFGVTPGQYLR